jgi:hypothetical protein
MKPKKSFASGFGVAPMQFDREQTAFLREYGRTELRLIDVARAYEFDRLTGELLVADHGMLKLCRKAGFEPHTVPEDGIVEVKLPL